VSLRHDPPAVSVFPVAPESEAVSSVTLSCGRCVGAAGLIAVKLHRINHCVRIIIEPIQFVVAVVLMHWEASWDAATGQPSWHSVFPLCP
jgi:hypothetical protein